VVRACVKGLEEGARFWGALLEVVAWRAARDADVMSRRCGEGASGRDGIIMMLPRADAHSLLK